MRTKIINHPIREQRLLFEANKLADALKQKSKKLVLAESCTGGLVAATLARIPGISEHLCGSMVVYRESSKQSWLQIPARSLKNEGVVSKVIAAAMAKRALHLTPEADISISITGHLGPTQLPQNEGIIFIGLAVRNKKQRVAKMQTLKFKLLPHHQPADLKLRRKRQLLASQVVLSMVRSLLN